MKHLFFILFISTLFALPRFSVEESSSCMNCHINPTGGGMRNDHGTNVYNLDELTIRKWISNGDEDWDGFVTDHIQIGGEFRIQSFDGNTTKATFPMQAEIYAKVDINKNADFYFEASLGGSMNYEYFILFDKLPKKSWIKVGQTSPNYGLMLDDHTSFIKSGNKNQLVSNNRDLDIGFRNLFDPMVSKPLIIEVGTSLLENIYITASLSQPLINSNYQDLINFTGNINYIKSFGKQSLMFGSSILEENDISLFGIYGGLSFGQFTTTFEIDRVENLLDDNKSSFASYGQVVYKPIQGLHLIAKYDYFDHDYDFKTGSIARYSYGLELYPLNMLEVKIQLRNYDSNNLNFDNEYLLQIHTWF